MSKRWPVDERSFENNKLIQPWPTVATLVKGECLWVTGQSKFWYASCPVTRARQVNFIGKNSKRARRKGSLARNHCSFAYSALASFRMGVSESASFQSVRKS